VTVRSRKSASAVSVSRSAASPRHSTQQEILGAEDFRRTIALERKRSERSRKPFMLLLLDMGELSLAGDNPKAVEKVFAALALTTRETDITGWYAQECVIGVVFTEIAVEDNQLVPGAIVSRVTETLRGNLAAEDFDQLSFSFHVFPEEWNQDNDDQMRSNPTLYPDLRKREDTRRSFRAMKRAMDIAGSLLALLLFSPIFLVVPVIIKLTSEGPVFFRQRRAGQYGKSFVFLKFRSMYVNNDAAAHKEYVQQLIAGKAGAQVGENGEGVYKMTKDPRITPVGAWLRKTSMDELPQFLNVLRGEMSLVGPRPPVPYEVEAYDIWHRRRLLEAKPGITGLWQVCGRSRVKFDDMVRLDLQYARTWSPWMDIKILARTPGAVVLGAGAL
jgi:lipopolysaccharide/colanic/teichoic acid biosynthesis glycosyltransferase